MSDEKTILLVESEALKESEAKYRPIFDNAVEGIFQTTPEGRFLSANPALAKMFGYESPEELMSAVANIGNQLYVNQAKRLEHLRILNEKGSVKNYETEMYRKDSGIIWVSINTRVVGNQADKPLWYEGFVIDITERKRMEEALKLSRERLEDVQRTAKIGNWEANLLTGELYWSQAIFDIFGYDSKSFKPSVEAFYEAVHPDDRKIVLESETRSEQTGLHDVVHRIINTNGEVRFVHELAKRYHDDKGKLIMLRGTVQDITERKRVEEALKKSESHLNALIDVMPDLVWLKKEDGVYLNCNNRLAQVFGAMKEEIIGKTDYDFVDKTLAYFLRGKDAEAIASGKPSRNEEGITFADGHAETLETIKTPIYTDKGQLLGVLGIGRDITDRKLAEDKINSLLAEKELLLREVHHRIKNHMNVIMSLLSLQSSTMEDNPSAVAALEDARSRVQSMMVLYDKLYRSADFRAISTKEYLTSLIDEIVGNFPKRQLITVEKKIDDVILGAKILSPIGIIVNELLTNTMKHAFVGREAGLIRVSFSVKDNHATLIVQDNGIGMPESVGIGTSTGFGMQLVNILTAQLDGTIRFEGENETRFVLDFEV